MFDCIRPLALLLGLCLSLGCGERRSAAETDETRLAAAQKLVEAGQGAQALDILQRVAAASDDARVLYKAALLQQLAGDVPAAIAALERAAARDPAHALVRAQLGTLLALSGRLDEARTQAEALIERAPDSTSGPLLFAALAGPGDLGRAIAALEAVRGRASRKPGELAELELLLALSDLYERAGQRTQVEAIRPAIERARLANPSGALQLAHVYRQVERRGVSEALLRAAGETEPGLPVWMPLAAVAIDLGHFDLATLALERVSQAERKRPEYLLLRGSLALELGQAEQAIGLLSQGVALLPAAQQGAGRMLLARAYVKQGNRDKAEAELRAAERAGGLAPQAQVLLADLLRERGDSEGAARELELLLTRPEVREEAFRKLVALRTERGELELARRWCERWLQDHPKHAGASLGLARIALAENRTADAIAKLEGVLEAHPGEVRALDLLAATHLAAQQPDRAQQAVEQQLRRAPSADMLDFAAAYFEARGELGRAEVLYRQRITLDRNARQPMARLASLLRKQGRVADALPLYQQALAIGPADAALALEAAPLEAEAGQFAEAIAHYEQALASGARSPGLLNNLAYTYAEHGQRLDRALELALEARGALPDSLEIADTLGWVYARRGEHAAALPLLRQAAQGLPKRPNVAYHLGVAELAAGEAEAGRRALQRCLALRPPAELERAARHALAGAGNDPTRPPKPL